MKEELDPQDILGNQVLSEIYKLDTLTEELDYQTTIDECDNMDDLKDTLKNILNVILKII